MSDLTLWCLVVDDVREPVGSVFKVKVASSDDIADLAEKILAETPTESGGRKLQASDLSLWKPSDDFKLVTGPLASLRSKLKQLHLDRKSGKEANNNAALLDPPDTILEVFNKELTEKCVHVLVQLPEITSRRAFKRLREETSEILERLRAKKMRTQLPPLHDLFAILDRPLDEAEKVAISHDAYDDLITPLYELDDTCKEEHVAILFKRSAGDVLSPLSRLYATVVEVPSATGTEDSFHEFWDKNIKDVLKLFLQQGKSFRNGNHNPETKKMRPGFGLLVQNVCVFRGEEKGPENLEDPRAELADKLTWVYNPAEYLLGYYCRGLNLTLVAICSPSEQRGKPVIQDLRSANLRLRRERIVNIRRLINLSTLFKPLSDLVQSASGEFQPMQRNYSTVEITASCIVKTYTCYDAEARVQHLKNIYALLHHQNVPNTDRIIHTKGKTLYLAPRGIPVPPKIQVDLRDCVVCVLEALVVLHEIPLFHRDIRWANIIRNAEKPCNWILIDWEEATTPPTKGEPRFNRSDHSPRILEDNHGAEVDIWGVGHLITSSTAVDLSNEFKALGKRVCEEAHKLTAQEVLKLVKSLP